MRLRIIQAHSHAASYNATISEWLVDMSASLRFVGYDSTAIEKHKGDMRSSIMNIFLTSDIYIVHESLLLILWKKLSKILSDFEVF